MNMFKKLLVAFIASVFSLSALAATKVQLRWIGSSRARLRRISWRLIKDTLRRLVWSVEISPGEGITGRHSEGCYGCVPFGFC